MIKKIFIALGIAALIVIAQSFITNIQSPADEHPGPVHWYSFSEAVALQKKAPKPIMVDIYTSWCGPCKMMSTNTFGNAEIAKYLNENFYPVKFNAETYDSVSFNGYVFKNKNAPGTNRPVHDFAVSILDGKLVYPSIVFLNEQIQRIQVITGYYQPAQFDPIMKFFGSGKYKEMSYEDFQKTLAVPVK
ncbi:MAG: thioredoxin-related protein [Bacteroidota bacterium]|jgi:thioredoxin-related protein|nr:thioredoxin-related protein [Bacteroidota bacterium]